MQALKVRTRWAAVFSALFLFILIHFAKDILAIIPLSAMAAIIMLVGANMLRISQFKHHFSSRIETVVFFAAFVSVHIFGLLNAVLIGAGFAFINWVWRRSHPTVTCHDNEISIHGEMYYATIPVIEPFFYKMFAKYPRVSVNLVNVSYMDTEAARWLTKLVHVKDHEVQFILSSNQTLEKDLFNNASTDLGRLNIIEAA